MGPAFLLAAPVALVVAAEEWLAQHSVPDGSVARESLATAFTWGVVMGRFADRDALRVKADELKRLGVRFDPPEAALLDDEPMGLDALEQAIVLAEASGNERFAWDSYRRLVQMFGKTVLDIDAPW